MKYIHILILSCVILSACSEKAHDVSWYLEHPEERQAQLQKCSNNPGKLEATEACINARSAADKAAGSLGRWKSKVKN